MIKPGTHEIIAATATLAGMAAWGWAASRRAKAIHRDVCEVIEALHRERAASRIIARAGFEAASKAPMERRHLKSVN